MFSLICYFRLLRVFWMFLWELKWLGKVWLSNRSSIIAGQCTLWWIICGRWKNMQSVSSKYTAPLLLFVLTSSRQLWYIICSWKCTWDFKLYSIWAMDLHVIRGLHCHCLKVHENPYLWAVNKTVVPTITVHSCIKSTKGYNTYPHSWAPKSSWF
jgi:hypothetical protein